MSDKSSIEWTRSDDGTPGATWNPLRAENPDGNHVGWHCEHVSEGCRNCYAEQRNKGFFNLGTRLPYARQSRDKVVVYVDEKTLKQPLRWRDPRRVFVCSMTDLFGEWHTDEMVNQVFNVMYGANQHTFQILTKRPERMYDYISSSTFLTNAPFANVWLGVSVEDQKTADERIPWLLKTPAAVRWVSAEPLLAPVDLSKWLRGNKDYDRPGESVSCILCDRSFLARQDDRDDLETPAIDRRQSRREAGRAALEGSRHAREGGEVGVGRLPNHSVFGRQEAAQGLCPSCRVDAQQSSGYTGRDAGQSRERSSQGQPTGKVRADDTIAECYPRHPGVGQKAEGATGGDERFSQANRGAGPTDPITRREDGAVSDCEAHWNQAANSLQHNQPQDVDAPAINWIIVGGESGPGARPFDLQWARDTIAQCKAAGVPVFVKQLGAYPVAQRDVNGKVLTKLFQLNKKGGDITEWPEDLRVREYPQAAAMTASTIRGPK